MSDQPAIDLSTRLALSQKEAAAALGVCERTFRDLRPQLPCIWVGRKPLFPVEELRKWLASKATAEQNSLDTTVREIFDDLTR